MSSPEEVIRQQLPTMSAKRADDLVERILDALAENGFLVDGVMSTVGIQRTHIPIEYVEAYGLEIGVDANGYASEISSCWGLEVVG